MEKTCMHDVFYLRKIFDACAITLEKISFMRFNPTFFCLICRMIFTRALKIGAFYRAFVFCSGQSDVKTSGPNQTIYRLRNMPLHVERIVGISKCQANSKLIHVIKQVDIYWMSHTSGSKKVNHISNLLCRCKFNQLSTNINVYQLFEMNYFYFFLHLIPVHSNVYLPGQ